MRMKRDTFKSLKSLQQMRLKRTSLQLRLTAGITTIALLGVGAIGTWTAWQMRQMLLVDHERDLKVTATRLQDHLTEANPSQWQATVDEWAAPDLWVGIKQANGKLSARSGQLGDLTDPLMTLPWAEMPLKPTVQTVQRHQIILYRQPLKQAGRPLGELYLARDITHDYRVLSTLINTLLFAALLALASIAALIAMYVSRSLRPLRRMNQLAAVQAGKPRTLLLPQPVPAEMQGFVEAMSSLSHHLSETGERQREFTNSLSHELRTSLCLIQGYLQRTLRKGDNLTPAQREALEVAASEAERTTQLLQDLLDLGRINSGKLELCLKPMVLNDIVESAIQTVDPQREHTIELLADGLVVGQTDMKQLSRVLVHLLKNAKQFSSPDQPIQVKLSSRGNQAILQVSDRGCGIPASDQSHIFEPFYRVESSRCRSTGGMGLGLAIVKALVEAMAGEVILESTSAAGSTFTVKLPLAAAATEVSQNRKIKMQ